MKQEFKREYFKEKYDFICCNCGAKLWAIPSMMMTEFGINQGHGSCKDCKEFLHLKIEDGIDGEVMISVLWDDYLEESKTVTEDK